MAKAILIMCLSSLTMIGILDIFKAIKNLLLKPKKSNFSIILPLKDNDQYAEYKIRYLSNLIDNQNSNSCLIIADLGMDLETLQTCYASAQQDHKIIICSPQEITNFVCNPS